MYGITQTIKSISPYLITTIGLLCIIITYALCAINKKKCPSPLDTEQQFDFYIDEGGDDELGSY